MGVDGLLLTLGVMVLVVGLFFLLLGAGEDEGSLILLSILLVCVGFFLGVLGAYEGVGSPLTNIGAGEYRVAFVYQAEDNVSLGLIIKNKDEKDHLVYYQFQKEAFEGMIPEKATRLVVVEAGSFKRLSLK